mmetsp:Transcript_32814/g.55333  ORF Transcript_32814/g.55333 Transcript_32814/m.55333 type:complete len:574 (-) Transcript_32814:89-1810(-)
MLPPLGKGRKSVEVEEYVNPFKLPGDDQIFRMREEERRMKEESKLQSASMRIWEKSKKDVMSSSQRLKEMIGDEKLLKLTEVVKSETEQAKMVMPRRQEKENTAEFVAKKREMFLVQMSLDTKREEIRKLEEKAQMKEEALQRSEQMLEEDAMRFDAFLKENDKKAHDAIKRAEEETKKKQEKNQEIKRLTQQIQAVNSEMSKHREALEDCMRYKNFLDMLTPPEWFEQHKREREEKIANMKKEAHEIKHKEWEKMRRRMVEKHRKEVEAKREAAAERKKKMNHRHAAVEEEEEEEPEAKLVIPPPPRLEDEVVDLPEEEVPMYFTQPQQLMDIFSALEEQNLFLIQNSQETEHTLEELRHAFAETKVTMDAQTGVLQQQIDELQLQLANEDERLKALRNKRSAAAETALTPKVLPGKGGTGNNATTTGAGQQTQVEKEALLADLNSKVRYVYDLCGFDASSKPSTLFMLSQMESKLEVLLQDIERMPVEYVIKAEKEKEKRRREHKRAQQQAQQEKQQEERNRRAIERSMQAPKKRNGPPIMYRSRLIKREQKHDGDEDIGKDNNDEIKYLS